MERIVGVLDVLRELDYRELPVVYRDYNHICSTAYDTAEMVLRIEIACHPTAVRIEHNDRMQLSRRLVLGRKINADRDMFGDLLIVYIVAISS